VRSSALSLGAYAPAAIGASYGITMAALAVAAWLTGVNAAFWLLWLVAGAGMVRETSLLQRAETSERRGGPSTSRSFYGQQFASQVSLGGLLLLALVIGRAG
jgi:4-hydroxybenzoate polyprenyltransferase